MITVKENVVYWDLQECAISITNMEVARIALDGLGKSGEIHITGVDSSNLQFIRDSVLFYHSFKDYLEHIDLIVSRQEQKINKLLELVQKNEP